MSVKEFVCNHYRPTGTSTLQADSIKSASWTMYEDGHGEKNIKALKEMVKRFLAPIQIGYQNL